MNPLRSGAELEVVALDLEWSGQGSRADIFEVAAVRFGLGGEVASYQTLVRPMYTIGLRLQRLGGVDPRELEGAPPFAAIARDLEEFLGRRPIVGHSIGADLEMLARHGMELANDRCDTFEVARLLLPNLAEYSLGSVAARLRVEQVGAHRARSDARVAGLVFLGLLKIAQGLPPAERRELVLLTGRAGWNSGVFWRLVEQWMAGRAGAADATQTGGHSPPDAPNVERQRQVARPLVARQGRAALDVERLAGVLGEEGPLARRFPSYEARPGQIAMLRAVATAFQQDDHLLAEAGTGIGKSIAYLIPALAQALVNNTHVVISTNTISLQDQLILKDIPNLVACLDQEQDLLPGLRDLRVAVLKGRTNYLCLRRWRALRQQLELGGEDALALARLGVWLRDTATGDRAEIQFSPEDRQLWSRVSAQNDNCLATSCPHLKDGSCYLVRARRQVEGAHLIVVNHALLLSDALHSGGLLPEYRYLVIDEAHRLEDVATDQLGFDIDRGTVLNVIARLSDRTPGQLHGLLPEVATQLGRHGGAVAVRWTAPGGSMDGLWRRCEEAREGAGQLFSLVTGLAMQEVRPTEYEARLRLTPAMRGRSEWGAVERRWEALDRSLQGLEEGLAELHAALEECLPLGERQRDDLLSELATTVYGLSDLRGQLHAAVLGTPDLVTWVALSGRGDGASLHGAPLAVGPLLEKQLFQRKSSVVLASATLRAGGTFDHFRERVGLPASAEVAVDSPFDYGRAALLLLPADLPEPNQPPYTAAVADLLRRLAWETQGRMLVLFTSHAALRAVHRLLAPELEANDILVLGQGLDGQPARLLSALRENSRTVVLGTSSFWEGVDVVGPALSVVVMARLPFAVPTDPVFAARSECYEQPFVQYALPEAVLRFRQGFGRLIRSSNDRGILVSLDRRLEARSYGRIFLQSLPPCPIVRLPAHEVPARAGVWLAEAGHSFARGDA
ncbi:MAG: hypothetical protein HYY05_05475 [Chloroflexi bacterium]|nr:hypothetical protein [Chloroflexota bacterium]